MPVRTEQQAKRCVGFILMIVGIHGTTMRSTLSIRGIGLIPLAQPFHPKKAVDLPQVLCLHKVVAVIELLATLVGVIAHHSGQLLMVVIVVSLNLEQLISLWHPSHIPFGMSTLHPAVVACLSCFQRAIAQGIRIIVVGRNIIGND